MTSSRRTAVQASALVLAGAVAGGVLAATVGASASTPSATPPSPSHGRSWTYAAGPGEGWHRMGPMTTGTVTAVGASSVTIKTSSGTKSYTVDANSDIDKNGEAKLSDLAVGDAVRFVVRPGTSTIAVLHAGDEAKNRPAFGAPRGPGCDGDRHGARPMPSPTSTSQ